MSGREGYCNSSVSCWDRRFGYGQCRRCGVPHFVTNGFGAGARSHIVESTIRRVQGTWVLSIVEEMVDARPSTGGDKRV